VSPLTRDRRKESLLAERGSPSDMGIADIFKRKPKEHPVTAGDLNVKIAYSGLPTPLAANVEALLSAYGEQATKPTSVDLQGGESIHFFTLRRKTDAPVEGRRLVLHVYASARPSHPDTLSNLFKGASVLVLLHYANESAHIDREWLDQARARGAREFPVVVQVVYPDAFARAAPGVAPETCNVSGVRDGFGLPRDAPIIATSRPSDAAAETFETAVRLVLGRLART
jgi:hypothetical protein